MSNTIDEKALVGKRFRIKGDEKVYGGREGVSGLIKSGTIVEIVSFGCSTVHVAIVDCAFGRLSWDMHFVFLEGPLDDEPGPLSVSCAGVKAASSPEPEKS